MRRHIPGLHSWQPDDTNLLEGFFLVRIDGAFFRWQQKKSYLELRFAILEPLALQQKTFVARLRCTGKALWELTCFLRDFRYDAELLSRDELDVKALFGLRGVVRTSPFTSAGRTYQNIDAFASVDEWTSLCTDGVRNSASQASTRAI